MPKLNVSGLHSRYRLSLHWPVLVLTESCSGRTDVAMRASSSVYYRTEKRFAKASKIPVAVRRAVQRPRFKVLRQTRINSELFPVSNTGSFSEQLSGK